MNRRQSIKNILIGSSILVGATGLYASQIEPYWYEFVHHKMPIANLPSSLEGKSIMQISDIHIGNCFDFNYIINAFKKAQSLLPDIVVYTGDYVSYENEEQFNQLKQVMQHAVIGTLGTAGILGNHDYGSAWSEHIIAKQISRILSSVGVVVLSNEQTSIAGLNIFGLDDYWGPNFNPSPILRTIDKQKANIVLCHNPDVCDLDVWSNYQGWILSGHTHGGQCKAPFLPAPILPVKNKNFAAGIVDLDNDKTLYINRALGHLWPVRFNVRPEITIFKMTRKEQV